MAVFEWIGHLVLLFKIQGGINFACLFSGGLKKCCKKIRGAFFRSRIVLECSKKNQGGLHDFSENSGGRIVIPCTDQKEAPLNFQRFLLQIFSPKDDLYKYINNVALWPVKEMYFVGKTSKRFLLRIFRCSGF